MSVRLYLEKVKNKNTKIIANNLRLAERVTCYMESVPLIERAITQALEV